MEQCPICFVSNPANDHLIREYKDMMAARFQMFRNNAKVAQDVIAKELLARGITHIPNIFGDIPIISE